MALFKVLRGTASSIDRDNVNKPPFVDGYAYFTPDDGRFYIDVQLDTEPPYFYDSGVVGGKNIYRIEIESKTWAELVTTKSDVGHHHSASDIDTGILSVPRGGTGIGTTTTVNSVLIGNSTSATGNMQTVATANGAFYATSANGKPQFGTLPVGQGGTGQTSLTSGQVLIGNGTNGITTKAIDTTAGGTDNSDSLITSGAVYDGLSAKSDAGHHHNISDINDIIDVQSD